MLRKLSFAAAFVLLCGHSHAQNTAKQEPGAKFSLTNKDSVFDFCEIEERNYD